MEAHCEEDVKCLNLILCWSESLQNYTMISAGPSFVSDIRSSTSENKLLTNSSCSQEASSWDSGKTGIWQLGCCLAAQREQ